MQYNIQCRTGLSHDATQTQPDPDPDCNIRLLSRIEYIHCQTVNIYLYTIHTNYHYNEVNNDEYIPVDIEI